MAIVEMGLDCSEKISMGSHENKGDPWQASTQVEDMKKIIANMKGVHRPRIGREDLYGINSQIDPRINTIWTPTALKLPVLLHKILSSKVVPTQVLAVA